MFVQLPESVVGSRTILMLMLNVNIDLSSLEGMADLSELEKIGEKAAANLALLTQAKVQELAGERLHSRLDMFRKGLSLKQEKSGVWLIHLDTELGWVNDGFPAHSLIPDLVNSPKAHMSADGHKYIIVPFQHKGGPTQNTPAQMDLVNAVKQQMKKDKIPWAKVEKDSSGMPLLGRLHKLKVQTPSKTHEGPGQGWGAVGAPRVGATGIPFLQGAAVHQSLTEKGKVERSVMTFRVASEKHEAEGRWHHPGLEPTNILEDAYEWALKELETNVMPDIVRQISEITK
jgi:hypothetical protein